jgi:hypothetical protein
VSLDSFKTTSDEILNPMKDIETNLCLKTSAIIYNNRVSAAP